MQKSRAEFVTEAGASTDVLITVERRVVIGQVFDGGADDPLVLAATMAAKAIGESTDDHDVIVWKYGAHEFTLSAAPARK